MNVFDLCFVVMVNEQDDGNFDDYETSDVVQEIYDADINIDQSNSKLH